MRPRFRPVFLAAAVLPLAAAVARADEPVRVTVVAVLASARHAEVDPKLKDLAREVQKRDPTLTGFRLGRMTCLPLTANKKETYPLVDEATAEVTLLEREKPGQRTRLTIKAPDVGEITYETCCGKFFPICTRCVTDKQENVIMAVMVKPCPKKP